ncbi:hypothetical protein QAD02_022791 [Eretmocerus hayati]|uniref:Uncharacterized protein n=1 Tax=Eretmocerus hayati TaxID=131215 RepID=A0ACC2PXC8_9HYME|nr:hypothetical protein QAD02_022791 [Eretmocerus hayati]
MRILHFAVISQALSICRSSIVHEEMALDHLFNNIKSNIDPHKLNVITECSKSLSALSNKIVQKVNKDFVSSNIDCGNSALIMNKNMTTEQLKYYGLQRVSERMSLTMGIVESENGSNPVHNLTSMLENFDAINPLTRGKYLLIIITKDEIDLRLFFREAWSKRFLDLTVLEWNQKLRTRLPEDSPTSNIFFKITVHSFNPFSDTFNSEILDQHTSLFPNKMANLCGFPLGLVLDSDVSFEHEIDMFLVKMVCEKLNCETRDIAEEDTAVEPTLNSYHLEDVSIPFDRISFAPRKSHAELTDFLEQHLTGIYIPIPDAFHLYLMRPKEYRKVISVASILTFSGLFFTACIFAVWARLLGFKVGNWTFLNILTAQMGSSLEHPGRMKMSEKIFLMSIYIATLIIVTFGTDYMLEIFVYRGELANIETIEDLANSDVNLGMEFFNYKYMSEQISDFIYYDNDLKEIHGRIKPRIKPVELSTFCRNTDPTRSLDESINLCYTRFSIEHDVMTSDEIVQIDKIRNPIIVFLPTMRFTKIQFFKERWEELIYRFLELGMLESLKKNRQVYVELPPGTTRSDKDINNKTVPLEEQVQPIFFVGCTVSIFALICEMIWHRLMKRTEVGRLLRAFHHRSHSASTSSRIETKNHTAPPVSDLMMTNTRIRKFSSQPNPVPDCQRYAQIEDTCFGELSIVNIDHHGDCVGV